MLPRDEEQCVLGVGVRARWRRSRSRSGRTKRTASDRTMPLPEAARRRSPRASGRAGYGRRSTVGTHVPSPVRSADAPRPRRPPPRPRSVPTASRGRGRPPGRPPGSRSSRPPRRRPHRRATAATRRSRTSRRCRCPRSARRTPAPATPTPSQRPIITFCWLPPDSVPTRDVDVGGPDVGLGHQPHRAATHRRRRHRPGCGRVACRPSMTLSATDLLEQQTLPLAIGGQERDAAATLPGGDDGSARACDPVDVTRARDPLWRPAPDSTRASSETPAPMPPVTATISWAPTVERRRRAAAGCDTERTSSGRFGVRDGRRCDAADVDSIWRPNIAVTTDSGVKFAGRPLGDDGAVAHDGDVVGDAEHLVEVVRDEQHGDARRTELDRSPRTAARPRGG